MSLPVSRPAGHALVVAHPTSRAQAIEAMSAIGFECAGVDDPYSAMEELVRRPTVYRALVLGLAGIYREELELIRAVKRRFSQVEVWLTQTDGRHSALAEAMRLGADGLLAEDGLHRTAMTAADDPAAMPLRGVSAMQPMPPEPLAQQGEGQSTSDSEDSDEQLARLEPVLTADELQALLEEQPIFPPDDSEG